MVPPVADETLRLVTAVALVAVMSLGLWLATDRWSPLACAVRLHWSPRATRLLTALVAITLFGVIAEDVLLRGTDHALLAKGDQLVRASARQASELPLVKRAAKITSRVTGEGLVVLVVGGAIALVFARRRRDAMLLVLGTSGAWLTSGVLKLAFGVPRPRAHALTRLTASVGFPSGHAFVTLVACGLAAWMIGREASGPRRLALFALAVLVASLAGASRLVLDAHWLSDVVAGLAVGTAWLGLLLAFF